MTRQSIWGLALFGLTATAAYACSGGTTIGGTNGAGSCLTTLLSAEGASSACVSCVSTACPTEIAALQSACATALSCACPNGTFDETAANTPTCSAAGEAPECQSALEGANCTAARTTCVTECQETVTFSPPSGGVTTTTLPPGIPSACVGDTAWEAVDFEGLCAGGAVYFICDDGTYEPDAYCSLPAGYTLASTIGDDAGSFDAEAESGSAEAGEADGGSDAASTDASDGGDAG